MCTIITVIANNYLRRRRRLCFWCSLFVCLSVCLSVCPSDYSQTCERILTKFLIGVGHGSRTKWYNFGGDPDHASDPGVQSLKSGSSGLLKKLQTDLCHAVFGGGLFCLSASSFKLVFLLPGRIENICVSFDSTFKAWIAWVKNWSSSLYSFLVFQL